MIIREFYRTRADGVNLYRTYSDEGKYVVQNETGIAYNEAIDVETAPYTYTEGEVIEIVDLEEDLTSEETQPNSEILDVQIHL